MKFRWGPRLYRHKVPFCPPLMPAISKFEYLIHSHSNYEIWHVSQAWTSAFHIQWHIEESIRERDKRKYCIIYILSGKYFNLGLQYFFPFHILLKQMYPSWPNPYLTCLKCLFKSNILLCFLNLLTFLLRKKIDSLISTINK